MGGCGEGGNGARVVGKGVAWQQGPETATSTETTLSISPVATPVAFFSRAQTHDGKQHGCISTSDDQAVFRKERLAASSPVLLLVLMPQVEWRLADSPFRRRWAFTPSPWWTSEHDSLGKPKDVIKGAKEWVDKEHKEMK